jgi:hypothetical protein
MNAEGKPSGNISSYAESTLEAMRTQDCVNARLPQ